MGTPIYNLPYPTDYTGIADEPEWLKDLAEATENTLNNTNTLLNAKENTSNKVTSLSSSSTDTEYPSAKCVYDIIGDIESALQTLNTGGGVE